MDLNKEQKDGIVSLIINFLDGKKSHIAALWILCSALAWGGTYILSVYAGMNPVLAEGIRTVVEWCGWVGGAMAVNFLRLAIDKSK
jgi:hypothetical protein